MLETKVIEAELDTIKERQDIIKEMRELIKAAREEKDNRTALMGLGKAVEALESLDKRLGRFTEKREIDMNVKGAAVVFYIPENNRDKQKEIEGV